ncbi:MAG: hypothetical protein R8J94_01360 [Acidimicrobiia bacterium]|nr:hypothetical protein [Acidimicrobiia bacterium]
MSIITCDDHVDDVLARLQTVVGDAAALSLVSLSVEQLNTWLVAMVRLVSQAQGLQASAMQEAEASGLPVRFGSRVLTTHLAKATNGNAKVLGPDRTMAIWLRDFPMFHQAMVDGVLSRSHVVALKSIDSVKVHGLLVRDQQIFIDAAKDLLWPEWKGVVGYWLNAANPDGELSDPADPTYGMSVRTKTNGDVTVTIHMDPITGEAFLTMHEREVEKISRHERNNPNVVAMSPRKKNLAALMRLMVRGFQRNNGTTPVPLINIVMSEKVAEDLLARTFGHETPNGDSPLDVDPFSLPIDWEDIDGRCETIRGTPVHPKHALGLLLIGKLRRTVMTTDSQVINLGRDVRFFTAAQRNALLVQSRGQCVDGCQNPFAWLEADHVHPHSKGGHTNIADGIMRCRPDNHAKADNLNGWWNKGAPGSEVDTSGTADDNED